MLSLQISSHIMPSSLEESTPNDRLRSLVEECGVSPHKLSEIAQELPPEDLSDVLVQYYFTYMYVLSRSRTPFSDGRHRLVITLDIRCTR